MSRKIYQFPSHRTMTGVLAAFVAVMSPVSFAFGQATEGVQVAVNNKVVKSTKPHPLDPALLLARQGLKKSREEIKDYTCVLVKREQINGMVGGYEYMFAKIRNRKMEDGKIVTPLSVYMTFLKPANIKGREVLFVEGQNNGKMLAHEGTASLLPTPSVWIRPNGLIAMRNNRYPITEVGIENLIVRLVEKGERDVKRGECDVKFRKNATINGRKCTMLHVTHPHRRAHFDFHVAQIFIDDELGVPIRYAAYDWPAKEGGRPILIEEYTYLNLKVNVGLTNEDFDRNHPNFNF